MTKFYSKESWNPESKNVTLRSKTHDLFLTEIILGLLDPKTKI